MNHAIFEKNSLIMLIGVLITVSIGGLVQIAPLFWVDSTIEKVEGVRPYTPLEQAGRDIYVREACGSSASGRRSTLRDEVERYGHYSLAAESMYDHPFQWGSKRTGPDLARVGGKYSNQWHLEHMINPRSVVPESIMPGYPWMAERELDYSQVTASMKSLAAVGVPYTQEMIDNAKADLEAQVNPDSDAAEAMLARYPKAKVGNFDGDASKLTEMDAMIAYLQILGTMVDFTKFDATGPNLR